jgi:hypothetical protein
VARSARRAGRRPRHHRPRPAAWTTPTGRRARGSRRLRSSGGGERHRRGWR